MRTTLFIVARIQECCDLSVETFTADADALAHLSAFLSQEGRPGGEKFRKATPGEDPEDYVAAYYFWVREHNDNMCERDVVVKCYSLNLTIQKC